MEHHHKRLWEEIKTRDSLAFVRYADGEVMLLKGVPVYQDTQAFKVDGWNCQKEVPIFRNKLKDCLRHKEEYFYYGIPCNKNAGGCCQLRDYNNVRPFIQTDNRWITFANLLSNGNWAKTCNELTKLSKEVVLFTNENTIVSNIPCNVVGHFKIPRQVVYWYETNHEVITQQLQQFANITGKVFLFAAGPLSEILIDELYTLQPNNIYLDVGSTIDHWIYGRQTRPYMDPSTTYYRALCSFI